MRVVVGGTFGVLHRGHRALLSRAFGIGDYVCIGLTTDAYVHRVKGTYGIPSYDERRDALEGFAAGLGKSFEIVPIDDKFGPATRENFDAIVVSEETKAAAIEINAVRQSVGLSPLRIDVVTFVLADDAVPISTTRILVGEIDPEGHLLHGKDHA